MNKYKQIIISGKVFIIYA